MKKKTALYIIIAILFVCLAFGSIFLILNQKTILSVETIPEIELFDGQDKVVKAFLKDVYNVNNKKCLTFLQMSEDLAEYEVCTNPEILEWENIYKDYSKLIPVSINIEVEDGLLGRFFIKSITLTILEDIDFIDFIYTLEDMEIEPTDIRVTSTEEILKLGYYTMVNVDTGKNVAFAMTECSISGKEIDDESISLSFVCRFADKGVRLQLNTNKISFYNQRNDLTEISISNMDHLLSDEEYQFVFSIDEDFQENQLVSDILESNDQNYLLPLEILYVREK